MKTKILISRRRIQRRVGELARAIDRHYRGREIAMVGVLNGSIIFLADLVRRLNTPVRFDCMAISCYGKHARSPGKVVFHPYLRLSLRGRHVLLVDDIFDTGLTLQKGMSYLRRLRPSSLEICVLLRKRIPRRFRLRPRFVGFDIPNEFVYGYGLDFDEFLRNVQDIVCRVESEKPTQR